MPAYSAEFVYEIIDLYSARIKAMQRVTNTFNKTTKTAGRGIDGLGNRLGKMSSKLANLRTGFAATMLTMGLKGAIKSSFEFETIMNKVEAVTQSTAGQMTSLRKEAKAQGLATRFSAVQAAQGMEMLGVRGYKTAQILELIPQVLTMATAGDLEMATASGILTGTLKTFGMGTEHASRIVDVYAVTAANTASNMSDLNSAMKNFGPLGHAAGMQFEEMTALVGALSDKNIMGSASGTLLMNSIRNLIKPTREAIEEFQRFGIPKDLVTKASGEISNYTALLEAMEKKGMGVGEIFRIFQVRGAKAVAALRGQIPVIREIIKKYDEQSGAGKTMADIMEQKVTGSTHRAISAWQGLKVAIGKGLEPLTMAAQEKLTDLFVYIAENPSLAKNLGITLGTVTALLIALTLVGVVLGTLAAGVIVFGAISLGVFAAVAAAIGIVIALIISLASRWDDAKHGFSLLGGGAVIQLMKMNFERNRQRWYKLEHAEATSMTLMEQAALRSGEADPLTSTGTTPALAGQTSKILTETNNNATVTIRDETGPHSSISVDRDAGANPVNIDPNSMKY